MVAAKRSASSFLMRRSSTVCAKSSICASCESRGKVGGAAFPEYSNCNLLLAVVVAASAVVEAVVEAEMEENVDRGERKEGLVLLGVLNPMTEVVSWESAAAHTKPAIADRTRFLDGFIIGGNSVRSIRVG